jgi:hypothetical protein
MSSTLPDPLRSYRYGVKSFGQKSRNSQSADPESDFGQSITTPSQPHWIRRAAFVFLLLGLSGLLVFLMRPGKTTAVAASTWKDPSAPGSASILPEEEPAPATKAHLNTASPVVGQGLQPEQIADKFLAANTPQERLRWVRRPTAVADLMERFYQDGPGSAEKVADFKKMPPGGADDQAFERFTVTMTDGSKRLLCVPFDESGSSLGVDYKSYARHCNVPWSAVLDGTATKADEMRVFLQRGNYYNYAFTDERQWLCLIATSPELENPIHLYARTNNPDLLLFLQHPPQHPQRYTIAIENIGQGHLTRQWQLTQVITTGWVAP